MTTCSSEKCSAPIFDGTEDWDEPLCYEHWQKNRIETLYELVNELVDKSEGLRSDILDLREVMKELK